jgi:putative ABC transport system permease protein
MNSIALRMLFGDRDKYIAMIVGIAFAALIMTQQPGIYFGIMNRTHSYVDEISLPDIWVMDPAVEFVEENKPLRDTELQRVRSVEGVEWATPLFQSLLIALMPNGTRKAIDLTGVDDATLIGAPTTMVEGNVADLRQEDAIILDQASAEGRFAYAGADGQKHPLKVGDVLEINDHRAVIVGIAKLARTFTTLPLVFTTYTRAMQYRPSERRMLTYVLVKAKPGFNLDEVTARIRQETKLAAYTADEFKNINKNYWMDNTGIPINFGISTLLGFLVGAAIAGQTFYTFVRESLKQYATLKAMGVTNEALKKMVLLQAAVVGLIGYGLGVGISAIFGGMVHDTSVAFSMPWQVLFFSAAGIALIVGLAAMVGVRSVIRLDPVAVFRN